MEEMAWKIRWSMALQPDASMLPDRSVFLRASGGGVSLTATVSDWPELLPGMWEALPFTGGGEAVEECYYNVQTRAREDMPLYGLASGD